MFRRRRFMITADREMGLQTVVKVWVPPSNSLGGWLLFIYEVCVRDFVYRFLSLTSVKSFTHTCARVFGAIRLALILLAVAGLSYLLVKSTIEIHKSVAKQIPWDDLNAMAYSTIKTAASSVSAWADRTLLGEVARDAHEG
jgi:hypothetical protein